MEPTEAPVRGRSHRGWLVLLLVLGLLGSVIGARRLLGMRKLQAWTRVFAVRDGAERTLEDGDALLPGEGLVLDARSPEEFWLYVFRQDDQGRWTTLFPLQGSPPANPLAGHRAHRLPSRQGDVLPSWAADAPAGTECFVTIASRGPSPIGEALRHDIPEASRGPGITTVPSATRALIARGLPPSRPPGDRTPSPALRFAELSRLRAFAKGMSLDESWNVVTLRHAEAPAQR